MMNSDDFFYIKVRRCKRCGRILTGEKAVRDGYGTTCRCRMERAKLEIEKMKETQPSLFDLLSGGDDDEYI